MKNPIKYLNGVNLSGDFNDLFFSFIKVESDSTVFYTNDVNFAFANMKSNSKIYLKNESYGINLIENLEGEMGLFLHKELNLKI